MSDDDTGSKTASNALRELRAALSAVRTSTDVADTHILGTSALGAARAAVSLACSSLRSAADAAATSSAKVTTIQGDAARRAQHVKSVRDTLAECRDHARQKDPFAPHYFVVLHRVKGAAEAADAQAFEGSPGDAAIPAVGTSAAPSGTPITLLTVCGTTFLADFLFYPQDVLVHFRHLVGADSHEVGDKDVDEDFADLVRKERIDDIELAFRILIRQERLEKSLGEGSETPTFQLKDSLRAFEDDLLAMHVTEKAALPNKTEADLRDRGLGIICRSSKGLIISFSKIWYAVLGVEAAFPAKSISAGSAGPVLDPFNAHSVPVPFPTFQFSPTAPVACVNAQYTLTLSKPIISSTSFAARFASPSGGSLDVSSSEVAAAAAAAAVSTGKRSLTAVTNPFAGHLQSRGNLNGLAKSEPKLEVSTGTLLATAVSNWTNHPTLEGLLAPDLLSVPSADFANRGEADPLSGGDEVITKAAVPGSKYLKFSYTRGDCVPGVRLHNIPLAHPRNVHNILRVLRQQLVFNALFASCFATAHHVAVDATPTIDQPIEVVVNDAPSFLHFGMYDADTDSVVGIAVVIGLDGVLDAKIRGPKGKRHACSDAKASALFNVAHNAPLAIDAIRSIGQQALLQNSTGAKGNVRSVADNLNLSGGELGLVTGKGHAQNVDPTDSLMDGLELGGMDVDVGNDGLLTT